MALNGYLVNGVCVNGQQLASAICASMKPGYTTTYANRYTSTGGISMMTCYNASGTGSVVSGITWSVECEIPGPDLTSQQQVEAVNALFPTAVALLAVAWGLRFVRKLIERAAFSRPGGDE